MGLLLKDNTQVFDFDYWGYASLRQVSYLVNHVHLNFCSALEATEGRLSKGVVGLLLHTCNARLNWSCPCSRPSSSAKLSESQKDVVCSFLMSSAYRVNLAATNYKCSEHWRAVTRLLGDQDLGFGQNVFWWSDPCVLLPFREAESFKEQGNAYYAKKDYNEAYNYYTKAIGESSWWWWSLLNTVSKSQSWLLISKYTSRVSNSTCWMEAFCCL